MCLTVTRRVELVEQEMLSLQENMSSSPVFRLPELYFELYLAPVWLNIERLSDLFLFYFDNYLYISVARRTIETITKYLNLSLPQFSVIQYNVYIHTAD